jgi:hypothetical protein
MYEKMSLLVAKEEWQKRNDSECMIGLSERE